MRLFIALILPEKIKKILAQAQAELRQGVTQGAVKWVEPENFHQTIIFLGRVDNNRVEDVKQVLAKLRLKPIALSLKKVGFFPDQARPRVIWIGLKGELEKLSACFHQLRLALRRANFDFDTRFSPHITLGRVRFGRGRVVFDQRALEKVNQILKTNDSSFVADRVVLFESKLTPKGPIYTPIVEVKLEDNSV